MGEGIWNWDYYYNHTCFMKLGGAFETEDNNQAWLSPMKYPMSSGWRNTKTKVEFVLPASKAIMFLYFRLGQIGHTDDSAYGYACRTTTARSRSCRSRARSSARSRPRR